MRSTASQGNRWSGRIAAGSGKNGTSARAEMLALQHLAAFEGVLLFQLLHGFRHIVLEPFFLIHECG